MKKAVRFSDTFIIYPTYSNDEYPRNSIDSIIYRKSYNKVSESEWNIIFITLDLYKIYEMIVHKDSLCNNSYHSTSKSVLPVGFKTFSNPE